MNSFLTVAVIAALFGGLQAKSVFTRSGESSYGSFDAEKVIDDLCEKIALLEDFIPPCVETNNCTDNTVLNGKLDLFIGEIDYWYQEHCDDTPPPTPPPSTPPPPTPPANGQGGQGPPSGPPPTPPAKRQGPFSRPPPTPPAKRQGPFSRPPPTPPAKRQGPSSRPPPTPPSKRELKLQRLLQNLLNSVQ